MSNFSFLASEWPALHEAAVQTEQLAHADARASCFYARRSLELAIAWLYKHDRALRLPYQDNLAALIHEPSFRQVTGDAVFTKAKVLKDVGNLAVHSSRKIANTDAVAACRELFHICYWLARNYGQRNRPDGALRFNPELLPKPASAVPAQSPEQLQKLQAALQEKDEKLSALLSERLSLDEELKKLREEMTAIKQANAAQPDTHDYSEAETRDYFIDLLLKEAGWELEAKKNFEIEVSGMPNAEGKGYVDYVLWGDDGKPLALVEAKRCRVDANIGKQQAKLYADCLEKQYGQRPLIFYSNGYEHWFWDDALYPPRPVQGFLKKAEMELALQRRQSRKSLTTATINGDIAGRYYQTRAIRRIAETFEKDNQRKALVVMATGAGKTRTVIALADLMMRCNWAKRILFLADRVALVNQAVGAFKKHLPDASPVNLVTEKNSEGRVFVCTYPTMMGLIDEAKDGQRRFGSGHFDLIVIDEAHRSVYQKYRAIFDYFDSFLVGLTATPKDEIDRNTYSLFQLESGVPTDAYSLDEAVADGNLVPPTAISVPLRFQREGIKYEELSEEEKEQWDALEWDEDGNTPDAVDATALNNWLFNTDTVDKVLAHLMTHGLKVAGGDRLGKTIIFAKNNDHATFIGKRFDANYPQYKGEFARVITHKTPYAQTLIDSFSSKDKTPHIAISVDMLDTGIDVPEVVNLVFFKSVRSKTKFWQMLGRGTRLCPDLFGPGDDKKSFFLFDYCQNLEFFSENPELAEGSVAESLSARLFKARLQILAELDAEAAGTTKEVAPLTGMHTPDKNQLRAALAHQLHEIVAAMNVDNFVVRPQRKTVEKFAKVDVWAKPDSNDLAEAATQLAKLPSELVDDDEEAKRFDLLILRTQLCVLQSGPDFTRLRDKVREIAAALELQEAIPAIKAEMPLIQTLQEETWWEDVTPGLLENVRRRLRALVKLIEKGKRHIVYTDFEDELGSSAEISLPEVTSGLDMARFKEKARQFLISHENHLALQRLRRNQPLTATDLGELEQMLEQAGGSKAQIHALAEQSHGLGLFIRSLVGMDREAAMAAFSQFISGSTATADQIEFINQIVEELTQSGVMAPERLYQSPFTDLSPAGPDGIFPSATVDALIAVIREIHEHAVA